MAKSITLKGFDAYAKRLKEAPSKLLHEADEAASASARNIEKGAKERAPHNLGNLRASINVHSEDLGHYEVRASASYAAYVEFGTRKRVEVPSGLESYAAQFKGKSTGDYYDFLNAILTWVQQKGISGRYSIKTQRRVGSKSQRAEEDIQTAEAIAFSILRHGIHAQPFLFPAVDEETPNFYKKLKAILGDL